MHTPKADGVGKRQFYPQPSLEKANRDDDRTMQTFL